MLVNNDINCGCDKFSLSRRNRALVLSLALSYGDADALDNATELFDAWINDENY